MKGTQAVAAHVRQASRIMQATQPGVTGPERVTHLERVLGAEPVVGPRPATQPERATAPERVTRPERATQLERAINEERARDAAASIRAASVADLPALGDFFAGLSSRTRYLRFFAPVRPTTAMLRRLCGGTGGADALVAVWKGGIIGHAMAADGPGPSGGRSSDIGVVVADRWQGRGVGSALMRTLVTRAQDRGVTLLAMDVLPGNSEVFGMIASRWPAARTSRFTDFVTVSVRLPAIARHEAVLPSPGVRVPALANCG